MSAYRDLGKLLLGGAAIKLLGIAATLIFVRVLTKQELAVFPLYFMLRAVADRLLDFGITPYFIRVLPSFLREGRDRTRSLLFTGVPIVYAGLAVVTLLTFIFADTIAGLVLRDESSGWMIRIICLGFFPYTTTKMCEYVLWGRAQFGTLSFLQTLEAFVRPIAIVSLYLLFDLPGVVAAFVLVELIVSASYLYCIRDLFGGARPPRYPARLLLAQAFPLYVEGWLWYLRADGDNWLVSIFLGPAALAEYFVATIMVNQVTILFSSVDRVVVERLGRQLGRPDAIAEKALAVHARISQFVLPGILMLLALTPLAIVLIGGHAYESSIPPALVLMLVALGQFLFMPVDRSVFVGLAPRYRLYKTMVEAVVVFASAAILVPTAGLVGVAGARLAGQLAGGIYGLVILRRHLGLTLPFGEAWRTALTAIPGTILVLLLTAPVEGGVVEIIATAAAMSVVWLGAFLLLVLLFNRPFLGALLAEIRRALGRTPSPTS